ncbi:terpene cyclase/mutase family protein [Myxococcota bacterium]|nr:terpene cyclase/mutase family protein [Myxococcota bacterium]
MALRRTIAGFGTALFLAHAPLSLAWAGDEVRGPAPKTAKDAKWAPAVEPKPLSPKVNKGLEWLVAHQLPNGAWGQGEESPQMGQSMGELRDKGNVADTCIAALALLRAGSTPSSGRHAKNVVKALDFVMKEIEASDRDGLAVTNIRGTRVQGKIGPYVDTFMSSMLLSEVKGKMPDKTSEERLGAALAKVLHKIAKNQRSDGSWEGQAWAPVLSQALGAKGLNRAAQAGAPVSEDTLRKNEAYAQAQFDGKSGSFGGDGSAGVGLYSAASSVGAMADAANTRAIEREQLKRDLDETKDAKVKKQVEAKLAEHERAEKTKDSANAALLRRLDDPSFIAGFGSNGGEEFLSYMLVSESLVVQGGREWKTWDAAMTQNLDRVQNPDGSWTGHHCITGRTFVTASALLVLTADRAPVPLAAKMKQG